MILLWDSSEMEVELILVDHDSREPIRWRAERTLARDMLSFVHTQLYERGFTERDIEGIGVLRGPGSFTGLRIGLTVLNTWAHSEHIPIVGAVGTAWQEDCLSRLKARENDQIVLPEYGSPARITKPRK